MASVRGHRGAATLLLSACANVNAARTDMGGTSLMGARQSGNSELVSLLLAAKADVNTVDTFGSAALNHAAGFGYSLIVTQLLSAGATRDAVNSSGYTALMQAAEKGHLNVLQALFKAGADFDPLMKKVHPIPSRYNSRCFTFAKQAQQACELLADLKVLIEAGDPGAACALISKPESVALRVVKGKRTLFADIFEGVIDDIEAFNAQQADLFMEELLREDKEKNKKQGQKGGKTSGKKNIHTEATSGGAQVPAPAAVLDHRDMQVATALSELLQQCSAEWSSTSLARLRQILKDGGVDVEVSEKRMKRIKAWAVADALTRSESSDAALLSRHKDCCAHCGKMQSDLKAGEKLRKCGGCGRARYGSSVCQKLAWSAGHKKDCGQACAN